jgi:ABC-2 type transport system permease protein
VAVIVVAAVKMGTAPSFLSVLLFILSLFISIGILYAIMLIISSIAFWYRGTYVLWLLEDLLQAGRYPIAIYPGTLRFVLTWVFPLAFIVSVPAEALAGGLSPMLLLAGFAVMAVLFILAAAFFSVSQKKYTGASS